MRILLAHNSFYYPSYGGGDKSNRLLMEAAFVAKLNAADFETMLSALEPAPARLTPAQRELLRRRLRQRTE